MKEGKLVPMETTIKLLKDAMLNCDSKVFLVDGFPRALDQAETFEKEVRRHQIHCSTQHCLRQQNTLGWHHTGCACCH